MPRDTLPPPPPGFVLDENTPPPGFALDSAEPPPPPPGFQLDSPSPPPERRTGLNQKASLFAGKPPSVESVEPALPGVRPLLSGARQAASAVGDYFAPEIAQAKQIAGSVGQAAGPPIAAAAGAMKSGANEFMQTPVMQDFQQFMGGEDRDPARQAMAQVLDPVAQGARQAGTWAGKKILGDGPDPSGLRIAAAAVPVMAGEFAGGMATPENAVLALTGVGIPAKIAHQAIRYYFAADMAQHIPEVIANVQAAQTPEEKMQALGAAGAAIGGAGLMMGPEIGMAGRKLSGAPPRPKSFFEQRPEPVQAEPLQREAQFLGRNPSPEAPRELTLDEMAAELPRPAPEPPGPPPPEPVPPLGPEVLRQRREMEEFANSNAPFLPGVAPDIAPGGPMSPPSAESSMLPLPERPPPRAPAPPSMAGSELGPLVQTLTEAVNELRAGNSALREMEMRRALVGEKQSGTGPEAPPTGRDMARWPGYPDVPGEEFSAVVEPSLPVARRGMPPPRGVRQMPPEELGEVVAGLVEEVGRLKAAQPQAFGEPPAPPPGPPRREMLAPGVPMERPPVGVPRETPLEPARMPQEATAPPPAREVAPEPLRPAQPEQTQGLGTVASSPEWEVLRGKPGALRGMVRALTGKDAVERRLTEEAPTKAGPSELDLIKAEELEYDANRPDITEATRESLHANVRRLRGQPEPMSAAEGSTREWAPESPELTESSTIVERARQSLEVARRKGDPKEIKTWERRLRDWEAEERGELPNIPAPGEVPLPTVPYTARKGGRKAAPLPEGEPPGEAIASDLTGSAGAMARGDKFENPGFFTRLAGALKDDAPAALRTGAATTVEAVKGLPADVRTAVAERSGAPESAFRQVVKDIPRAAGNVAFGKGMGRLRKYHPKVAQLFARASIPGPIARRQAHEFAKQVVDIGKTEKAAEPLQAWLKAETIDRLAALKDEAWAPMTAEAAADPVAFYEKYQKDLGRVARPAGQQAAWAEVQKRKRASEKSNDLDGEFAESMVEYVNRLVEVLDARVKASDAGIEGIRGSKFYEQVGAIWKPIADLATQERKSRGAVTTEIIGPHGFFPLLFDETPKRGAWLVNALRDPKAPRSKMATGFGEYKPTMEHLVKVFEDAERWRNKTDGLWLGQQEGALWKGNIAQAPKTMKMGGVEYDTVTIPTGEFAKQELNPRTGKMEDVPSDMVYAMPKPLESEIRFSVMPEGPMPRALEITSKIAQPLTKAATQMAVDEAFRLRNVVLGIATSKAQGAHRFVPVYRVMRTYLQLRTAALNKERFNHYLDKAIQDGFVSERYGTVTTDKAYAEMTGAKLTHKLSPSAWMSGPEGIEARAKAIMWEMGEKAFGERWAKDYDLRVRIFEPIGIYAPALESAFERILKRSGIGPFATAGMSTTKGAAKALPLLLSTTLPAWLMAWYLETGEMPDTKKDDLFSVPPSAKDKVWWKALNMMELQYARRGANIVGLEGLLKGPTEGARRIGNQAIQPAAGPLGQAGVRLLTGGVPFLDRRFQIYKPQGELDLGQRAAMSAADAFSVPTIANAVGEGASLFGVEKPKEWSESLFGRSKKKGPPSKPKPPERPKSRFSRSTP